MWKAPAEFSPQGISESLLYLASGLPGGQSDSSLYVLSRGPCFHLEGGR